MKTKHALSILPMAAVALMGCGPGQGSIQLSLTNVPVDLNVGTHRDLSEASHFVVTVNEVKAYVVVKGDDAKKSDETGADRTVSAAGKSGWKSICSTPTDFDLQSLTDGKTTPMCPEAKIDEGKVTQLSFVIPKAVLQWKNGDPDTNFDVLHTVIIGAAKDVEDRKKSDLVLDLDAGASISVEDQQYQFSPTIKVKN